MKFSPTRSAGRQASRIGRASVLLAAPLCALLGSGCATPAARFDAEAAALGLARQELAGEGFRHAVYRRAVPAGAAGALHLYLDGDGSPWLHERWIAADPTPRDAVALRLMATDPAPSIYLGRPCYHGFAGDPGCAAALWTHARYSERVVASMSAAAVRLLEAAPGRPVVLVGYSGGGTLAMLMAPRIPRVVGVLTVAANLDVAAWAARHGYSPLRDSLDPARRPPLPAAIRQVHVAGADDANVPPGLIGAAIGRQPGARLEVVPGADHDCCWEKKWPSILEWIDGHR